MTRVAEHADTRWRSASNANNTCVELSHTLTAVRDSKHPDGGVLAADVRALVDAARSGRLG